MSVEKLDFSYVRQAQKSFTTHLNQVMQNIPDAFILGVYCYLSSLPHDWIVNRNHLMKHFDVGRDKIKNAMAWLNANFLIEYEQDRNLDNTFSKSLIVVKDGCDFIEKIINNQQHDSDGLKTSPAAVAGGLKFRSTEKPLDGKTAPTYINIKDTNTNKERERLSQNFEPNEENQKLLQETGQKSDKTPSELLVKFKSLMRTKEIPIKQWQDRLSLFLINEKPANHASDSFKNNFIARPVASNELRSTVKEWGPGHPDFDRNAQYQRPARK